VGGTLQVENGGAVTGQFIIVGVNVPGNMMVSSGGKVVDTGGSLGLNAGGTGFATVTGQGSQWSNQSLGIGGFSASQKGGFGVLNILDGGAVTVSGTAQFFNSGNAISISGGSLTTGILVSAGGGNSINLVSDPTGGHALTINGTGHGRDVCRFDYRRGKPAHRRPLQRPDVLGQ
jgi:fibronectin-binding autotransporter adhesin